MRKLIALLFVSIASATITHSQSPAQRPAATPNPPRPVLSEAVADARLRSLFDAARDAMLGMRFDEAVRLSDEGIAAAPNQPSFWLNRADALSARAVATRNRFYRSKDEGERKSSLEAARRDLRDALTAATRALALIDDYKAPEDEAFRASFQALRRAALWQRAQSAMMVSMHVDESYSSDAVTAFEQYAAAETDPAMLNVAHRFTGQLRMATNDFAGAAIEFRKVLDAEPADVEAMLGEALALIDLGHVTGDPAKLREGFDRLRLFAEKAPAHPARASAAQAVDYFNKPARPIEEGVGEKDAPGASPRRIVEGGVINGRAVSKPAPPYPLVAKLARAKGAVIVRILVNEQGDVVSAWAASGHPLLRAAAAEAASQAKFTPTTLSGRPVKVAGVITYSFVLQ
ncbi:MAG TPA: TonB family protein [Pyrinomonadaceae bacterium]|nr:TonB family protein [Pyrinomonadaceae bacterium]